MDGYGSDDIAADKSRNYTSFGTESIKLFASTVHSPNAIEAEVLAQLSEDTSYRLRELIASSFQYTRHSKRFKLTCDDVNRALKASDSQAIYGFSGSESSKEIHVQNSKLPKIIHGEKEAFKHHRKTITREKIDETNA